MAENRQKPVFRVPLEKWSYEGLVTGYKRDLRVEDFEKAEVPVFNPFLPTT